MVQVPSFSVCSQVRCILTFSYLTLLLDAEEKPVGRNFEAAVTVEDNDDGSITFRFGTSSMEKRDSTLESEAEASLEVPSNTSEGTSAKPQLRSSWNAKEVGGGSIPEADYLYELGRSDLNLNIDTAQNSKHLDSLFTGKVSCFSFYVAEDFMTLRIWIYPTNFLLRGFALAIWFQRA